METLNIKLFALPPTYNSITFTQAAFDALPPYFTNLVFNECDFSALDLSNIVFEKCTFSSCDFTKSKIMRPNSSKARSIFLCDFNNCNFSNADLSYTLHYCRLRVSTS